MAETKQIEPILPEYEIHVDGNKIPPDLHVEIYGIEVDQDVDAVDMFSLFLNAGEMEMEKYKCIDSALFNPGSEVKIRMGYEDKFKTLMIGEITSMCPDYPEDGSVTQKIQGYDRLYRLGFGRKSFSFRKMKDSDIAAQIAQNWKLIPDVDATDITHEYLLQNNQTDREFLLERARLIRYEVWVEDKTLYFKKPKENSGKIITLTYGENLIEFFPRMTTIRQTGKVAVRGWSIKDKKVLTAEAAIGDETSKMGGKKTGGETAKQIAGETEWLFYREAVDTREAAEVLARAKFNEMAMEFITGEGSCIGNTDLKAGEVIEIKNLGERFSGLYYIVSCKHVIGQKGYTTYFTVRRSAL